MEASKVGEGYVQVKRELPKCDNSKYCCGGTPRGQFQHKGHRHTFVPLKEEHCAYYEYARHEVRAEQTG